MIEKAESYKHRYELEKIARQTAEKIAADKNRELSLKEQEVSAALAAERTAKQETELLLNALKMLSTALHVDEAINILRTWLNEIAPSQRIGVYMKSGENYASQCEDDDRPAELTGEGDSVSGLQALKLLDLPCIIEDTGDNRIPGVLGIPPDIKSMLILAMNMRGQVVAYVFLESEQIGAYTQAEARLAQALVDESVIAMENARLFQEVERLSTTDPLTGLNNRRSFEAAGERELALAKRHNLPLTMIMLDIDHFKAVNDNYGHATGDKVLKEVTEVCRKLLRSTDVNLRLGGEEFGFLCPNTAAAGALVLAERIRTAISNLVFDAGSTRLHITVSLGIAELSDREETLPDLIKAADQALYMAKNKGRNRTELR